MEMKCSSCKQMKSEEQFMKMNKRMKTCFACREKTRKYSESRKNVNKEVIVKCLSCKSNKNIKEFMKKTRQLKFCFECREKARICTEERLITQLCIDEYNKNELEIKSSIIDEQSKAVSPYANVKQIEIPPENLQHEEDLFFGRK